MANVILSTVLVVLLCIANVVVYRDIRILGLEKCFGFIVLLLMANVGFIYIFYQCVAFFFAPEEI
jgi:hypothetical protein